MLIEPPTEPAAGRSRQLSIDRTWPPLAIAAVIGGCNCTECGDRQLAW